MDGAKWWPSGITSQAYENTLSNDLVTSFGKLTTWNFTEVFTLDWWLNQPSEGVVYGDWPTPEKVSMFHEDRCGIVVQLAKNYYGRIIPFGVGNDLSRLMNHQPWRDALDGCPIVLPTSVWTVDGHDRIAIYQTKLITDFDIWTDAFEMAEKLGKIHSSLEQFATPNTERRWNDRLADIESALKTNTLWRAPHSKYTVGLPRLNFDYELYGSVDGNTYFLATSRTVEEHLLCNPDRLPALSNLMILERQIARKNPSKSLNREKFLGSWLSSSPFSYRRKKALSTLLGGPWIWRYHAVLLELAEAQVYGDKAMKKAANNWLTDVSRIQAHLGVLRLWKSGLWAGISVIAIGFFGWKLSSFSQTTGLIVSIAGVAVAIACNAIYWAKDPDPY